MKFNQTIGLTLLACLSFSSLCNAQEAQKLSGYSDVYVAKMGDKILRSCANIALGIIEIPKNIIIVNNQTNLLYALSAGTGLGVLNSAIRISIGLLDLLTFPVATKPIVQPTYPWQSFSTYTSYDAPFVLDF